MTDTAETAQDNSGGSMLALYPPPEIADALAVDGGQPPDDVHCTIVYTGKAAVTDADALHDIARVLARRPPVTAQISGTARFTGGETDVAVALVDSPAIEDLRRDAMSLLSGAGVTVPREHGHTAHLTRAYIDPADPDPAGRLAAFPVTFGAVTVKHGGTRTDYPFTAPDPASTLAAEARTAYASGWALSGGPMTPRVKAGCAAAVAEALARPGDPMALEATALLGHLEGVQATIETRRERLLSRALKTVLAGWNECMGELDLSRLVTRYRADVYLTRTSGKPPDPAAYRDWWRDAGTAAALGFLRGIYRADGYAALVTAVEDAVRSGMAEGEAGALAQAAARQGITGFDIDAAFLTAYERLEHDPGVGPRALDALIRMIDGAGGDLGRLLARLTAEGATEAEMNQAAEEAATGDQVRAVNASGQWALWAALGAGAIALWARTGAADGSALLVSWVTDGNPCPACQANAAGSPYQPWDVPPFPQHPNCLCWLESDAPLPASAFAAFLGG